MKKNTLFAVILFTSVFVFSLTTSASAQNGYNLSGTWTGKLIIPVIRVEIADADLVLEFSRDGNNYTGTMNGSEIKNIAFDGKNVSWSFGKKTMHGTCKGQIIVDKMIGTCSNSMPNSKSKKIFKFVDFSLKNGFTKLMSPEN